MTIKRIRKMKTRRWMVTFVVALLSVTAVLA